MLEILLSRRVREMKEVLRQKNEQIQKLEEEKRALRSELFLLMELYADKLMREGGGREL